MSTAVLSKQVPIVRLMTSRAGPPWNRFTSSSAFPASRGRRDGLAFAVVAVVVVGAVAAEGAIAVGAALSIRSRVLKTTLTRTRPSAGRNLDSPASVGS
jgi:hypothetical protein